MKTLLTRIVWDKWDGTRDHGASIASPNWSDVDLAITQLDGMRYTLVRLELSPDRAMLVGGGGNRYVAIAVNPNDRSTNLVDSSKPDTLVRLRIGGQFGDYREKACSDLRRVLRAARTYTFHGILEQALEWEEQF